MINWLLSINFDVDAGEDEAIALETAKRLMVELQRCEAQSPDVKGSPTELTVTVGCGPLDARDATGEGVAAIRTAFHAIGVSTAGWPDHEEAVALASDEAAPAIHLVGLLTLPVTSPKIDARDNTGALA